MCSERKAEANRQNALLSTGPKTEEGKMISRANALVHGFCAVKIEIPDEDPAFVEAREQLWQQDLNPNNKAARAFIVHTAVKHSVRLDRLEKLHDANVASLARSAKRRRNNRRAMTIEELSIKIEERCDIAVRQLRNTAEGCQWLIDRFLDAAPPEIETTVEWLEEDCRRIAKLCGVQAAKDKGGAPPRFLAETINIKDYQMVRNRLWMADDPDYAKERRVIYMWDTEKARDVEILPSLKMRAEIGFARITEFVQCQIKELRDLKAAREAEVADSESSKLFQERFDASDRGKLIHRYEMEHERAMRGCLKELGALSKEDGQASQVTSGAMVAMMSAKSQPRKTEAPNSRNEATGLKGTALLEASLDAEKQPSSFVDVQVTDPKSPKNQR